MKKVSSESKVDGLRREIKGKILKRLSTNRTKVLSLRVKYELYVFDEYVSLKGIQTDGKLITHPPTQPQATLDSININELAEIEDIINP